LRTELIYDRKHVSKEAARLLFKCRPIDRIVAVSDSSMATGMPPNLKIKMWGLDCVTGPKEVRLLNGTLAGSGITLLDAFKNLAEDFGLETAIHACCLNPRAALKMTSAPRVYVELDHEYNVVERYVAA
jgi:N-acetylglucosamine-6-phosphate deacetylase